MTVLNSIDIHFEQDGAFVVFIYPNSPANVDKRLQIFDKITEVGGKKITADMSQYELQKIFKQRYLAVRMHWIL